MRGDLGDLRRPAVEFGEGGTRFVAYVPRSPISRHVALIWQAFDPPTASHAKVLPNGVVELIVNLGPPQLVVDPDDPARHTRYHASWLAGMQRSFIVIAAEHTTELLGIRFRPGGAHALLRRPLAEFNDAVVELELVERAWADELRDRLHATPPGLARVEVAEAMLLRRLDPDVCDPRVDQLVARLAVAHDVSIARLAADLGVSQKHLIHLCKQQVGLPPKLLARVLRFNAVVRALERLPIPSWADVAMRHGYSDQAHLIAEFRAFAGVTPSEYMRRRLPDANHIAVDR
jgi:AraC-like DNA-binding protein